jgi:hypothetical protein
VLLAAVLGGCSSIHNEPINRPLAADAPPDPTELVPSDDDVMIALSFSGGGTRAAAFSHGVLSEMDGARPRGGGRSLLDRVDFVSGVSGGSVAASCASGPRSTIFASASLLRDAEASLRTQFSLVKHPARARRGVNASLHASYTAFDRTTAEWQSALMRWRCGLTAAQRQQLGAPANWNCHDLKFFVTRVGFDALGSVRAAALDLVKTSFRLPPDTVDTVIAAGRDALRANQTYAAFLKSL